MNLNIKNTDNTHQELLEQVLEAIQGVRFGLIQIVIHDGKVVQIEKTEKFRVASRPKGT